MNASRPRQFDPVLTLAGLGGLFTVLAILDKLFGLIRHPLYLATAAYLFLGGLLALAFFRGVQVRPDRLVRLSAYAAFVILVLLTAVYVVAWRTSADPTPLVSQIRMETELRRGDALLAAGDKDGAHLVYRDLYGRYPSSFPVLMRMGAINYQVNDYERAKRYFSRALEVAPPRSRWRALNDLGQTYWKLNQPQTAVDLYLQAQQSGIPPSQLTEWHYRLAWAYFDLKEYDEAVRHYQAVVQANGSYVAASYYNIACALAEKLKLDATEPEQHDLAREAVENLRNAWKASSTAEELRALRTGLVGKPQERDPELEPLRRYAEFQAFLRELNSG